jgi:hypothetical protein
VRKPRAGWPLFWQIVAITFTVTLVVGGLAVIAGFVLYAVAISAYASNK